MKDYKIKDVRKIIVLLCMKISLQKNKKMKNITNKITYRQVHIRHDIQMNKYPNKQKQKEKEKSHNTNYAFSFLSLSFHSLSLSISFSSRQSFAYLCIFTSHHSLSFSFSLCLILFLFLYSTCRKCVQEQIQEPHIVVWECGKEIK